MTIPRMLTALLYLSCDKHGTQNSNKKVAVVKSVLVRSIAFLRGEVAPCTKNVNVSLTRGFSQEFCACFDTVRSPVRSTTESQLSGELATARLAILEQSCNLAYRLSLS